MFLVGAATALLCGNIELAIRNRFREWSCFCILLSELYRNNRYQRYTLPEEFLRLLTMLPTETEIFQATRNFDERLSEMTGSFWDAWEDYAEQVEKILHFSAGLKLNFLELGAVLPKTEEEGISHALCGLIEQAGEEKKQYGYSMKKRRTTKLSCVVLVGAMTMLLLW